MLHPVSVSCIGCQLLIALPGDHFSKTGPDMEMPNALGEMGRADPLPSRLRGLESSFPSGVCGRAPAENSSGTFRTPKLPFVNRVLLNVLRTKRTGNDVQETRGSIKYREVSRRKITCPVQSEIVDRTLCEKKPVGPVKCRTSDDHPGCCYCSANATSAAVVFAERQCCMMIVVSIGRQ